MGVAGAGGAQGQTIAGMHLISCRAGGCQHSCSCWQGGKDLGRAD
jgi:hypothetical protein